LANGKIISFDKWKNYQLCQMKKLSALTNGKIISFDKY